MGEFSGIDPEALLGMIKSFTTDKHDLRQRVSAIKSQFGRYGLDTSPLNELLGQCGWLDDQLPGLNRRLNLAAAMDHDHATIGHHMVNVPEPVITAKKAQAEGKALAEKYAKDTGGDPLHDVAAELAAHAEDPDFCSAFYAGLPEGVAVTVPSRLKAAHDPSAAHDLKIYSAAFGTAVSGAFPAPGFDKVEKAFLAPLPEDGGKDAYEDAANRLAMLHYGQFPVSFTGQVAKVTLVDGSPEGKDGEEEKENAWEKTEPYRKYLETFLAPFDIVAADHWIDALEKVASQPSEWVAGFGETVESIEAAKNAGQPISQALIKAAYEAEEVGSKLDAWEAFSPTWLKAAAGSLSEIRGLSTTLGALGIVADAGTIISPQDKGAMGWVDRGAAGVNGGLLVANMFLDEIPVVGEVTLVATGVYLAGDFLYHHFKPFHDVCDDVGHATVTAVKDVGHAASSAWHSVSSTVGSWF